jgi:transcriptional regulator with PAS, ATPase and Fis domain
MPNEAQILAELQSSMIDMDQLVVDIKTLLYGESGTGKTVFGMQILQEYTPEDKRIVFIDSARGYVSLNNHPELKRRTKRIQFEGLSQIQALANAIKQQKPGFDDIGAVMVD